VRSNTVRTFLAVILLGTLACLVACQPRVDRAKADRLAAARVQQYVKEARLNSELLGKPDVKEQDGKWLYMYDYRGVPKQSVAIIVFADDGRVEVSRMLEEPR
jgi:hypothetical protein